MIVKRIVANFATTNMSGARHFYGDILGLPEIGAAFPGIVDDLDPCLLGTARREELRRKPRASYLEFRFSQYAPLRRARRVDKPNVPATCSLTVSAWCQRCLHDHTIAASVTVNAQV